jgi:peptidoglycan hydrolase-like protein with peptidoglycan-binding domain
MSFRGQRFAVLSLVVGLSMAAPVGAGSARAADPSAADVQWAQTILKAKGLYSGRANGDFNEPTRAALRAYQKSAGLQQTGQLDAATSGHMLAARQSTTQSTMGNLAGPNGKPQPSQINRNVEPPKPLASPTTRVDTHGSETGVQALGVIGQSVNQSASQSGGHSSGRSAERSAAPAPSAARSEPAPRVSSNEPVSAPRPSVSRGAAPGEPVPQAAPRTRVDSIGQAAPEGMREAPDPAETGLTAPAWVRSLLIAVLGGAFGFAGFTFWRSGRRPSRASKAALRAETAEIRREPSFGAAGNTGAGAPVLRATRPS